LYCNQLLARARGIDPDHKGLEFSRVAKKIAPDVEVEGQEGANENPSIEVKGHSCGTQIDRFSLLFKGHAFIIGATNRDSYSLRFSTIIP